MLRKILVAVAAGVLITSFSLATIVPADAARAKKVRAAKVAPAPAKNIGSCIAGIAFFPVMLATRQPIC